MSSKILVVEDEAIISADLESTIESLGHDVVGVVDYGLGAISLAKTLVPDIIFMDVHLRGNLDGIETAFLIDGILEKEISFVFVSAYPKEHYRLSNLLGKHIWIQKPYSAREIEEAIKRTEKERV